MRDGLMMDDYPLALTGIVERAERFSPQRTIAFRRPDGQVGHTTFGDCAQRARRLATALKGLGIAPGDAVATLMWNQPEHVEVYFALPSMGAVLHTLNPRLHPDELSFIVNDAEDRAIVVDESLLEQFEAFHGARDFEHVIVVSREAPVPDGYLDYDALVDRRRADGVARGAGAALPPPCVTRRGRRGGPKAWCTHTGRWCCTRSSRRSPMPTTWARVTPSCPWCRCSTPTPGGSSSPRRWSAPGLPSRAPAWTR